MDNRINSAKLAELIAARQRALAKPISELFEAEEKSRLQMNTVYPAEDETEELLVTSQSTQSIATEATDKYGNIISYNEKQQGFINLGVSGESCVLIGAAGTGKTTCQKGLTQALIASNKIPILRNHNHKYLPSNVPGIVICAFTRRATNNIRRNVSEDMQGNCITIHKLLEYQPEFFEVEDPETGKIRKTMRFLPSRNVDNPLPDEIKTIIFEEGSMISTQLHQEVINAAPEDCQFIYLGDIQQLPPVFGAAILGYKLLELPVVELTEVYRQAFDSPIIKLAHRILSGNSIPAKELPEWNVPTKLKLHPWKKRISADSATLTLAKMFVALLEKGEYNPETDAILIPFNKSCGTDELNKHIANKIAKDSERCVYEIIHGFRKSYYSIGDKCLYDREDALIQNIYTNPEYSGAIPQSESVSLDYWGHKKREEVAARTEEEADIDFILRQVSVGDNKDEDQVRASSHCIELYLLDSDRVVTIKSAGELNSLILGYALTVHKAQGSEWDKVYLCLHQSHAVMLQRELLYTAVTRAKRELVVICEDDTFIKGIESQRIKGNTLEEKAEFFKGKINNGDEQS